MISMPGMYCMWSVLRSMGAGGLVCQEAGEGGGGGGALVEHAPEAAEVGGAPCLDGELEGFCHGGDVARGGDGGVGHDGGGAHLHGLTGLGGRADAGIDDDGQRDFVDEDLDELFGAQAFVGADGRAERHDAGGAGRGEIARGVEVGVHVGHDHEALIGQYLCGLDGFLIVGQQVLGVADALDFDEVPAAGGAREACDAHGFFRGARAGGVRQEGGAPGDVVEDVGDVTCDGAAQREGDDLRACVFDGGLDEVERVFARAEDEA